MSWDAEKLFFLTAVLAAIDRVEPEASKGCAGGLRYLRTILRVALAEQVARLAGPFGCDPRCNRPQ
jgi:hypothetical protein